MTTLTAPSIYGEGLLTFDISNINNNDFTIVRGLKLTVKIDEEIY